jgi:hypothetical protein
MNSRLNIDDMIMNDNQENQEDDDDSQNRMIDTHSDGKFGNAKSLYEIIYKLKHNTDLNELINKINSSMNLGVDRENMKIKLNSFEFDKFHEIKDFSNLEMTIYYSLSEK